MSPTAGRGVGGVRKWRQTGSQEGMGVVQRGTGGGGVCEIQGGRTGQRYGLPIVDISCIYVGKGSSTSWDQRPCLGLVCSGYLQMESLQFPLPFIRSELNERKCWVGKI